ncbi:MAG: class I tRNA ligase family protein [Gemmatimonadota bacterium]|nr:class I tRNA ligase family protein [Gemmatimonadota bacterium]
MNKFYVTTAIDYANGLPHVGHSFEKVGADVIARYRRLRGDDVRFAIGMDEHGQNVLREAERQGIEPGAWVDDIASKWQATWQRLGLSNTDFVRTTSASHVRAVQELVRRIQAAGDIYLDRYEGYYCERCEAFRKESELVDGKCPLHPSRDISWTEEQNYFFRLSNYTEPLLDHIAAHPEFIQPDSRRNEILRLLEGGLDDISASRSRVPWGVPFPDTEGHTVYVWFDALPNYLSVLGYPEDGYEAWWPADLHVIGKDITRFHCVIWPAMLMSAGLPLPATVWAHGFVMIGGGKLSKSEAERIDLGRLVDRHGPDAFRFILMREAPWDSDRDFPSVESFLQQFDDRYQADLANDLGNLLNRTVAMIGKYRDGRVSGGQDTELENACRAALDAYHQHMESMQLHAALEDVMTIVRRSNAWVDSRAPWALARDPTAADELDEVLGALVRALARISVALAPFMPDKADEIWKRLGGAGSPPPFDELGERWPALVPESSEGVLFPRIETPRD